MTVAERSAGSAAGRQANWPEVIATRVWLIPEDDKCWVAVAPEFDLISQGEDQALALRSLEGLLLDYLDGCAEQGLSFEEAERPIPFGEHLRFHWALIRSLPRKWMRQRRPAREGLFVPLAGDGAGC
jgi:predicted RNase H-like HicB family nuclease